MAEYSRTSNAAASKGSKYEFNVIAFLASLLSRDTNVEDYRIFYDHAMFHPFDDVVVEVIFSGSTDPSLYVLQIKSGEDKLPLNKYFEGYEKIIANKNVLDKYKKEKIQFWYFRGTEKLMGRKTISINNKTIPVKAKKCSKIENSTELFPYTTSRYKLSTWSQEIPLSLQNFFDSFYLYLEQPDSNCIIEEIGKIWQFAEPRRIFEYIDTFFESEELLILDKNSFDHDVLRICLSEYIVTPTEAIKFYHDAVGVWNKLTLAYDVTILRNEEKIEKYIFGCILERINIISVNQWNDIITKGGTFQREIKDTSGIRLGKVKTLKDLLIMQWKLGVVPLVLKTDQPLPILEKFSRLKKHYIIIDYDVEKRYHEIITYQMNAFRHLADVNSDKLQKVILISLQGRQPISLYEVIKGNTISKNKRDLMEAITCGSIIKLMRPRGAYLKKECLEGSNYMLFIIKTALPKLKGYHNYNSIGDNVSVYCVPNECGEYYRKLKEDPKFKSYQIYYLRLINDKLQLVDKANPDANSRDKSDEDQLDEGYRGLEYFFIDEYGENVFYTIGKNPIPIVGEIINSTMLHYIPRYLREGCISKKYKVTAEGEESVHLNVDYSGLRFEEEDFFKEMTSKIIIVTGDAGFGKTALMQSLLRNCGSHYYVLFRDLTHYKMNIRHKKDIYKELLSNMHETLSYYPFVAALHTDENRVVLILDSFDEVISTRREEVLELIGRLTEEISIYKIIIASRLLTVHLLIEKFDAQIFKIQGFSEHDTKVYVNYWNMNNINVQKMPDQFTENPLYLNMLRIISENTVHIDLINKWNLYDSIVKLKVEDCCRRINPDGLCESERENILIYHQLLALKAIFGSNKITRKLERKRREKFPNFIRLGMITCYDENGDPIFVHHTFAEFFVIQWLIENIDEDEAAYIYKEILDNNKIDVLDVYCEQCPLYKPILETNLRQVRRLCKKSEGNLIKTDFIGRTPLHIAVICYCKGYFDEIDNAIQILSTILQYMPKENQHTRDLIMDWNWINYYDSIYGTCNFKYGFNNTYILQAYLNFYMSNLDLQCPVINDSYLFDYIYDLIIRMFSISNINKLLFLKYRKNKDFVKFHTACLKSQVKDPPIYFELSEEWLTPLHLACIYSNLELVIACAANASNINATDIFNCTPLHYSVYGEQSCEITNFLLNNGATVNMNAGSKLDTTVLHISTRAGNVKITEMLLNKININQTDKTGSTILHYATNVGNLQMVEMLLKNKANIKCKTISGSTPLCLASEKDYTDIIQLFLQYYNLNALVIKNRWSLLDAAIVNENINTVQMLLESNANVNITTGYDSPLTNAVRSANMDILMMLLKHGADANLKCHGHNTPLTAALEEENVDIVQILLENGAKVNYASKDGLNPLDCAIRRECNDLVSILLDHQADVNMKSFENTTPLSSAIKTNNIEIMEMLLDKGADVTSIDIYGFTPLMDAAEVGNPRVATILLENNADVNFTNDCGVTPLYVAAVMQNEDMVKFLLDHKANPIIITSMEQLFKKAKEIRNFHLIEWLIRNYLIPCDTFKVFEDIDIIKIVAKEKSIDLLSEFNTAICEKDLQMIDKLLSWNPYLNLLDTSTITPLRIAIELNDKDIDEIFLRALLDTLNDKDLDDIMRSENIYLIKLVLRSGSVLTMDNNYALRLLERAIKHEKSDIVQILLEDQIVASLVKNSNHNPLVIAVYTENIIIINTLLQYGIDIDRSDNDDITRLIAAAHIENAVIIRALLENNANIDYVNKCGLTALYIAALTGNECIVGLLLEKEANQNIEMSGKVLLYKAIELEDTSVIRL
ncbi:ankyrin repeat-containing protein [Holotrichia oblita]|uniref:Ankyrin repeat-containing protein n=1 Tax=Holotrichia oblita TaxID=644536 RepID=A0ACB9SJT6_HOLOL|nr:ankyrin repeat-containing protein [Holotrichia oblita]